MLKIKNCREIELSKLKRDVNQFRVNENGFNFDKLFITKDDKYLILCHSISEVSMGAYYTCIVVFENNKNQIVKVNIEDAVFPVWIKKYCYLPSSLELILPMLNQEEKISVIKIEN